MLQTHRTTVCSVKSSRTLSKESTWQLRDRNTFSILALIICPLLHANSSCRWQQATVNIVMLDMHARQASSALCSPSGRSLPVTRLRQRHARCRPVLVRADLGGSLDHIITASAVSISVTAALLAVFTKRQKAPGALKGRRNAPSPQATGMGTDNFRWAVMGVIGCFPLFNWMAWVFGALEEESEDRRRLYYLFAALYALPLLRNGFDSDWFSITLLLTGIAHLQLERVAVTEPAQQATLAEQLRPLKVIKQAADAARKAATGAQKQRVLPDQQQSSTDWWNDRVQQPRDDTQQTNKERGVDAPEDHDGLSSVELEQFDRRLKEREAQRKRGKQ